jgi:hypothetical protein
LLPCADCGIDTYAIGEYYMLQDEVWQHAWGRWHTGTAASVKPEHLCIICLETRLGRMLAAFYFKDVPINDPDDPDHSPRLRDRLLSERDVGRRSHGSMR